MLGDSANVIKRGGHDECCQREVGGLEALKDGSSRPHHSPKTTRAEVVGKIVYLRSTYHFGPNKIAMYLERYHDIKTSDATVYRISRALLLPSITHQTDIKERRALLDERLPAGDRLGGETVAGEGLAQDLGSAEEARGSFVLTLSNGDKGKAL